ncbi:unnamed protein product [Phytomonas sp. Hart1]|nr:unnamed protein product [Phytomonas sp. Hart1]|eukprot:CCW68173.1 unnamed protein product [Phytomonas sp. isolate Hart1]
MQHFVKDRDMAGVAAFELSLQYILIRQDRSYHFLQFFMAFFSLIFFTELLLILWFSALSPLLTFIPTEPFEQIKDFASPTIAVASLAILLFIRASKNKYIIEPGDHTIERLNRDVLEPCLGTKFCVQSGKLYSDYLHVKEKKLGETFYSMRYSLETDTNEA